MLRQGSEWTLREGIIWKLGKIFILNDEELKEEILWAHHNAPIAGHPGHF